MDGSPPNQRAAEPLMSAGQPQAAPPQAARRVGAGVSAVGGLGAVVSFFLPWLVFVAAIQAGCRMQSVQVGLYNVYGVGIAVDIAGATPAALAIVTFLCAVSIIVLAAISARRPVLFRVRLLLAASLVGLAALGILGALAARDRVIPDQLSLYRVFLGFGPGFWVATGSLALALVGGAALHAAARPLRQRAPIGEIALASLGIVGLLSSTAAAVVARPAPFPSLTCAQQGTAPLSGGGAVYFTSADGVYALDAASGRVRWRCRNPLGGAVTDGAPTLADGVLFVASRDGYVYAIRADNAAILWRADVGGRGLYTAQAPHVAPVVVDGLVIGVNGAGQVYALRASDGAPAWASDATRPVAWSVPTLLHADGVLIYPANGVGLRHLTALDERTGRRLWQSPDQYTSPPYTTPSLPMQLDEGVVYDEEISAKTNGFYLVARAVTDGVARWSYLLSAPGSQTVTSAFTVAAGVVYLEQRRAGARQVMEPQVMALRARDGALMWSVAAPDFMSSQAPHADRALRASQASDLAPTPTPPPTPSPQASQAPTPPPTPSPQASQAPPPSPQATAAPPTQPTVYQGPAQVALAADSGRLYVAVSSVADGALDTFSGFDARNGAVLWRHDVLHTVANLPVYTNGQPNLIFAGDAVYLLDLSGAIAAFDARTGSRRWQFSSAPIPANWTLVPGAIAVGASPVSGSADAPLYAATSNLYAISPADGAVRWQFTPDQPTTPYAHGFSLVPPIISPPTLTR